MDNTSQSGLNFGIILRIGTAASCSMPSSSYYWLHPLTVPVQSFPVKDIGLAFSASAVLMCERSRGLEVAGIGQNVSKCPATHLRHWRFWRRHNCKRKARFGGQGSQRRGFEESKGLSKLPCKAQDSPVKDPPGCKRRGYTKIYKGWFWCGKSLESN